MNDFNGVIILNKPVGGSSHRCVSIARRALNMKKIGHTGTLDPLASGVLPLLVGTATRAADFLSSEDKRYRATILLGTKTDTLDITGNVIHTSLIDVQIDKIESTILSFIGEISQVPPMYSAIQVNGQRLYNLARSGIEIEREARLVKIFSINIVEINLPRIVLNVHCSKGTYIRTLAADIGDALGCGGCIEALERTSCGIFNIEDSITPDALMELSLENKLESAIIPVDKLFSHFRKIKLDKKRADRVKNGVPIYYKTDSINEIFRIYDENDIFIALSKSDIEDDRQCLRLIKGFYK